MLKFLSAALSVPILVVVYAGSLIQRARVQRLPVVIVVFLMSVVLVAGAVRPTPTTGKAPTQPTTIAASEFRTQIVTGESPTAPIVITFPTAMNPASVEQLLGVVPATAVSFSWDPSDTLLTVSPLEAWATSTFHTVTIEPGALDATGRPIEARIRSAFLTRAAVSGAITSTELFAGEATASSRFRIAFTGPVDLPSIAFIIEPSLGGRLGTASDSTDEAPILEYVADAPLSAGVTYAVRLHPDARDADGAPISAASASIRTAGAPAVVRFRPVVGSTDVAWTQILSVRFSEPMDRASTEAAWSAVEGDKAVAGKFSWAEADTVLVFDPTAALGYGQKVTLSVGSAAISRAGLAIGAPASATFTSANRPVTPKAPTTSSSSAPKSIGGSTWAAVEAYYLKLMNCTRQGGIVTSSGSCSSPGGRDVAALWQDTGITSAVARPYAKRLAVNNLCTHFSGGDPGDRLRAAGYTSFTWAENIGCRSGDPSAAVLGSHLFFQSEASYSGGHYVNLMNAAYDRVGIGVWVSGGRVRLVVDFYRPS